MNFHPKVCAVALIALVTVPGIALAEDISVDLSGETDRHLRVNLLNGSVTIKGYDGDQATISLNKVQAKPSTQEVDTGGLRKLPNLGEDLQVHHSGGEIIVRAGTADDSVQMVIQMPRDARVTVNSAMDGDISVDGMNGELELHSAAGAIQAWGIRSAASLHAQADDITASFAGSQVGGPATFSSWAGDVDISFPASAGADLRWRTSYGEVLTDLAVSDIAAVRDRVDSDSGTRIEGFTTGKLNGGGPQVSVTAYSGDITLKAMEQ